MTPQDHALVGILLVQVVKWVREERRAKHDKEQAESRTRKLARIERRLHEANIGTPDPAERLYEDEGNPITDHGLLPGLRKGPRP